MSIRARDKPSHGRLEAEGILQILQGDKDPRRKKEEGWRLHNPKIAEASELVGEASLIDG